MVANTQSERTLKVARVPTHGRQNPGLGVARSLLSNTLRYLTSRERQLCFPTLVLSLFVIHTYDEVLHRVVYPR